MLERNLIKRIVGPKREKVRGDWRKLHKEKLHCVGSSVNSLLLTFIKPRRMRQAGNIARAGDERSI
jgi:hypothetical protein